LEALTCQGGVRSTPFAAAQASYFGDPRIRGTAVEAAIVAARCSEQALQQAKPIDDVPAGARMIPPPASSKWTETTAGRCDLKPAFVLRRLIKIRMDAVLAQYNLRRTSGNIAARRLDLGRDSGSFGQVSIEN
jgi:hypothetical protein